MRGPDPLVAARLAATRPRRPRPDPAGGALPAVGSGPGGPGLPPGRPAPDSAPPGESGPLPGEPRQEESWLDEPWPDEEWREEAWLDEPWPLEGWGTGTATRVTPPMTDAPLAGVESPAERTAALPVTGAPAVGWPPVVVEPALSTGRSYDVTGDPHAGGWLPDASLLEHVRRELAARLPEPLRSGRWRPGRGGAVAISALAVAAVLFAVVVVWHGRPRAAPADLGAASAPVVSTPLPSSLLSSPAALVVDVEGRVRDPGVRRLSAGDRIGDALRAAGGALPHTDTTTLDLAGPLTDGEQIRVGLPGAATPVLPPAGSAGGSAQSGPVDLNTATETDLETLPGVGPVMAQRILAWRTAHGPFTSVGQLQQISGVGTVTYARLAPLVSV